VPGSASTMCESGASGSPVFVPSIMLLQGLCEHMERLRSSGEKCHESTSAQGVHNYLPANTLFFFTRFTRTTMSTSRIMSKIITAPTDAPITTSVFDGELLLARRNESSGRGCAVWTIEPDMPTHATNEAGSGISEEKEAANWGAIKRSGLPEK
jgi:hypothetical protein